MRPPEAAVADPHFRERGFFVEVDHADDLGRSALYPGAPYRFSETPWRIRRRAPDLGEHTAAILCGELGLAQQDLVTLRQAGVV